MAFNEKGFAPKVTSKGTELPLMNLKGKPYLQVAHRLVWFREDYPLAQISTHTVSLTENSAVFKAQIAVPTNDGKVLVLATAHKSETADNFADFIEKAETGAIGRALAMAGYGTQFDPELDEGDRLADAPIAIPTKGGKSGKAVSGQPKAGTGNTGGTVSIVPDSIQAANGATVWSKTDSGGPTEGTGTVPAESLTRDQLIGLIGSTSSVSIAQKKVTKAALIAHMKTTYGVDNKEGLTDTQAKEFLAYLQDLISKAA